MRKYLRLILIALMLPLCGWSCTADGKLRGRAEPTPAPPTRPATTKAKPEAWAWLKAQGRPKAPAGVVAGPVTLTPVDLSDAVHPVLQNGGVVLSAAKNESTSFVLQVGPRTAGAAYALRLSPIAPGGVVDVYQVLTMPVDVNRAGYMRHTGHDATRGELPRALIPMRPHADGTIDLASLRDAMRPSDPSAKAPANAPALLWVDVRIPAEAPAGDFTGACDIIAGGKILSTVPLKLTVYDFTLPRDRHLEVVGRLDWNALVRLYPDRFETIRPHLMNRREERYADAVKTLDGLLSLAHQHRTSVIVPRLHPTVKWPALGAPQVDWSDFDSLAGPWLTGDLFDDKRPMGFWPLPAPDLLDRYNRKSQLEYWADAATHFDQNDWLARAPVWIEKITPGRATDPEAAELTRLASETIAVHQRVRAAVPLETDQLNVIAPGEPLDAKLIDPATTPRILSAAPGLVFAPPMKLWPDGVQRPDHYLRTDMPALLPYIGAGGDERDVRLWAWLAYLRQASLINFSDALPSLDNPTDAADPNELIWFYPGEWFGLAEPVPTIQLKWLRRAQQDFEYLWLARDRADKANNRDTRLNTLMMARLIAKPVEIQPNQPADPAYTMMSGTTSQPAWIEAQKLLAEMILMHPEGQAPPDPVREHAVHIRTLQWAQPQERPLLMGRTADWSLEQDDEALWLRLKFGVDLYNASDIPQRDNLMGWSFVAPASGWQIDTRPVDAPALPTYNVRRAVIEGRFDLSKVTPAGRQPMELTFTNGFRKTGSSLKTVLPVATSDRREGNRLTIDGQLSEDWNEADLIQDGPLVKMLSRPGLQRQQIEMAGTPTKVFTSWAANNFYVAFDLGGVAPTSADATTGQNFVDYQFRRAWGEDLCEILIQPLDAKGLPGPILHVVCKPNGSIWVERKLGQGTTWTEVEARIPYKSRQANDRWQGEVSIPWKAILDAAAVNGDIEPPTLLRFNVVQHRHATAESASWAGPVDFGRDESLMGILYLRDPESPGPRGNFAEGAREGTTPQER